MSLFTITGTLLKNILPKPFFNEMLLVFTQSTNSYKVAIDNKGDIMDIYNQIGETNPLVAVWLQLMAHSPTNFESIESPSLDLPKCESEIYLLLATNIVGEKKVITNSTQDLSLYTFKGSKIVEYNGIDVKILDKDDALNELRNNMNQNHSGLGDNVAGNKYG